MEKAQITSAYNSSPKRQICPRTQYLSYKYIRCHRINGIQEAKRQALEYLLIRECGTPTF